MRERPILFSAPMVRALLDGTKTQTRRIVKWRKVDEGLNIGFTGLRAVNQDNRGWVLTSTGGSCWEERCAPTPCPYGAPGDRLWVRETWQYADWTEDGEPYIRYGADKTVRGFFGSDAPDDERLVETWEKLSRTENYEIDNKAADRTWRPSIFMPRWASRLTLEITDVRVERLQEMAAREERGGGVDAVAEGIECVPDELGPCYGVGGKMTNRTGYAAFARLWNSINGDGAWNTNPWVWVVSFRPVRGGEHPCR